LNATNNLRLVRVYTDSTLVPGETLVGMTQRLDGQMVDHANSLFINRLADRVQTSSYFSFWPKTPDLDCGGSGEG
jgi:hypothetical protein